MNCVLAGPPQLTHPGVLRSTRWSNLSELAERLRFARCAGATKQTGARFPPVASGTPPSHVTNGSRITAHQRVKAAATFPGFGSRRMFAPMSLSKRGMVEVRVGGIEIGG